MTMRLDPTGRPADRPSDTLSEAARRLIRCAATADVLLAQARDAAAAAGALDVVSRLDVGRADLEAFREAFATALDDFEERGAAA